MFHSDPLSVKIRRMSTQQVLFLCTGNSCRSQMAEAVINHTLGDRWIAYSAGTDPAGYIHPLALRVLAEVGIDHSGGRSKSIDPFLEVDFDLVVTVCDAAAEACPVWPGRARRQVHLGFIDPAAAEGDEATRLAIFRQVLEEIKGTIPPFLQDTAG